MFFIPSVIPDVHNSPIPTVFQFLHVEETKTSEIHQQFMSIHGEIVMSKKYFYFSVIN
jgi:hypothetical protein